MADFQFGKGVYIWQPGTIEQGNPESIAARLQMAGVQTAALKICDGFRVLSGYEPLVQTLRNHNIRVGAWGYSYLTRAPFQEAYAVAEACHQYSPDFYLIDVEAEVEGNHGGARMFMNELRPAVAGLPLGLCSFWSVRLHPDFPWADFMSKVDFVCPQVYWRGVDPVGKLIASQQGYAQAPNAPEVPMPVVAGDLFLSEGVKPTPEQVLQFLNAADSDPFIQGVLMWAADDTQTAPDLWQAFSAYQWKQGGRIIPPQPLGWAKIKAPAGMWVRSVPNGDKVASLNRSELVPIWAVSDTKWGAVSQAADRWIFLGNPNFVETTLRDGAPLPPASTDLALYQARVVPARGLNVRDAVNGHILRALPVHTLVHVFEERNGWARIHPLESQWVNAAYLTKIVPSSSV
jgi:hypothetical protein